MIGRVLLYDASKVLVCEITWSSRWARWDGFKLFRTSSPWETWRGLNHELSWNGWSSIRSGAVGGCLSWLCYVAGLVGANVLSEHRMRTAAWKLPASSLSPLFSSYRRCIDSFRLCLLCDQLMPALWTIESLDNVANSLFYVRHLLIVCGRYCWSEICYWPSKLLVPEFSWIRTDVNLMSRGDLGTFIVNIIEEDEKSSARGVGSLFAN